jgi:uncharacterized protein YukE
MPEGTVLATTAARDDIRVLRTQIGDLRAQMDTVKLQGNKLHPGVLDGPSAQHFYVEWGETQTAATNLGTALDELVTAIDSVSAAIMQAGGGAA